jgi:hypothetical protein
VDLRLTVRATPDMEQSSFNWYFVTDGQRVNKPRSLDDKTTSFMLEVVARDSHGNRLSRPEKTIVVKYPRSTPAVPCSTPAPMPAR